MTTVVIPYANNPYDLCVLLMQLQCQTTKPRVIFLADNSKDGSGMKIAKRYHWSVPIAVMPKAGKLHESWNKGMEFAENDTVAVINDDILIPNDFISVFQAYAESGAAMMYCPDREGFPPRETIRKDYEWISQGELAYRLVSKREHKYIPTIKGWCMVIPKETREQIGNFDEGFKCWYGDTDYEERIFRAGGNVCFIKGVNVHHYGTSSFRKVPKKTFSKWNLEDQKRFEEKYDYPHQDLGWG